MLISYEWLKDFVNLDDITPEQLADKMSRTGIEVEEVKRPSDGLKKIVVGEVVDCIDHPNSDHLHICQVNIGEEVTQIVCGAPNVATGQKVIVALPGARIVDNVKIKKGKMRGEASNGMLCALEEIGISESVTPKEYADGIYILPDSAVPGDSVFDVLGMNDALLDLAITPNRADALSIHGASYEIGAIYHRPVTIPTPELVEEATPSSNFVSARVENEDKVPTYMVRVLKDVTIKPSPQWMQNRLMHAGIRPINNVVDITNYIMLEYGQPLHAYDARHIDHLTVRYAHEGETMTTLDDEERTLSTEDIVITNDKEVMALAGVMGGKNSEVTNQTTDIILEAAVFNPVSIRRTSQRHNLRTDASIRFEKGINQATPMTAMDAACVYMQQLADATVMKDAVIATQTLPEDKTVQTTLQRVNHILGSQLTKEDIRSIFDALAFDCQFDGDTFTVTVPPRRWDIDIEADIIEEIIRIYGYHHLKSTLPSGHSTVGALTQEQQLERATRRALEGMGLQEVISYVLLTEDAATSFALTEGGVVGLDLPMSQEHAYLRRNMIQGLLQDVQYNVARKNQNLAFYEVGTVFTKQERLPKEALHLGIALTGQLTNNTWDEKGQSVDFFTLKGIVEQWLAMFNFEESITYVANANRQDMHPGRCADVYVGDTLIGYFGQIHPMVEQENDVPTTYVAEFDLDVIFNQARQGIVFHEVPKFPSVTRDVALLVDETIQNADLMATIHKAGGKLLTEVTLFDLYQGRNIEDGKKSMAYQLTFVNPEATLTDEDIERAMAKIINALEEQHQAVIR